MSEGMATTLLMAERDEMRGGFTSEPGEVVKYDGEPDPLVIPTEPAQEPVPAEPEPVSVP